MPEGAVPFVLPGAEVNPVEGVSTAYDSLVVKYSVEDPTALRIGSIVHDYEVDAAEDVGKLRVAEAAGLFKVVRGLARTSRSDQEILERALVVFDSLNAQLAFEASHEGPT